jgi:hypothetical protein
MANIKISILNACTVLRDADIEAAVPALQTQLTRDFSPPWRVDADLDFVPRGQNPPPGHWWLAVLDNSDTASALGYHDVTSEGLPLAKIFAGTDIAKGYQWTVTASHELLEMLDDPAINLTAQVQPDAQQNVLGRLYAYEVCDACKVNQ